PVLVIAGDDEARTHSGELRSDVQRLLSPRRLDHAVTSVPAGGRPACRDGTGKVLEADERARAHALGHLQSEWPTGKRDDPRTGTRRERRERRADESYSHDRYGLARLDRTTAEDIHDAGERLAGECAPRQRIGQPYDRGCRRDVVFRVSVVGEQRNAVADGVILDAFAYGIDRAPSFMAGCAGTER